MAQCYAFRMDNSPNPALPVALDFKERDAIADAHGINRRYLYQCLTGRRQLDERSAVRLEEGSGQRIRRWHVRQTDWHLTWPELIGAPGAPPVPDLAQEVSRAA